MCLYVCIYASACMHFTLGICIQFFEAPNRQTAVANFTMLIRPASTVNTGMRNILKMSLV